MEPTEKPKFNWTRLIITIVLVVLTAGALGGGVWYYMNQQSLKAEDAKNKEVEQLQKQIDELKKPAASTTATTAAADPTASWKTYTNDSFGLSFKYPASYSLRTEGTIEAGKPLGGSVILEDTTRQGNPKLSLTFNPDGLGGCMLDRNDYDYDTSIQNGKLTITSKKLQTTSECPYQASVVTLFDIGRGHYLGTFKNGIFVSFSYDLGNYQAELDQIIGTVRITKESIYGTE
jgi:hypothetical protein